MPPAPSDKSLDRKNQTVSSPAPLAWAVTPTAGHVTPPHPSGPTATPNTAHQPENHVDALSTSIATPKPAPGTVTPQPSRHTPGKSPRSVDTRSIRRQPPPPARRKFALDPLQIVPTPGNRSTVTAATHAWELDRLLAGQLTFSELDQRQLAKFLDRCSEEANRLTRDPSPAAAMIEAKLREGLDRWERMSLEDQRRWVTPDPTQLELDFRHAGWAGTRAVVRQSMLDAHFPASRIDRFDHCGSDAWVFLNEETGDVAVHSMTCHDRYCLPCANARARRIAQSLVPLIEEHRSSHIVLTVRSSDAPLNEQVSQLLKWFTQLRRWKVWKKCVPGGFYAFELTKNRATKQWHPHIHVLGWSDWIDRAKLSAEWSRITGGSWNVGVSRVTSSETAVREVTKYVSKPLQRSILDDPRDLPTVMHALHGRHLSSTFGSWRGKKLLPKPDPGEASKWKRWGTLNHLRAQQQAGDTWAVNAWSVLRDRQCRNDAVPDAPLFPMGDWQRSPRPPPS